MKKDTKGLVKIELIENFRKEKGLSKKAFCKECFISERTYQRILTGKNFLVKALFKIAKVMNVKIIELLTDIKNKNN